MTTTPYMGLILPDVSSTVGPTWATQLNTAFGLLDAHDHVSGRGNSIPIGAVDVNEDVDLKGYNGFGLRSLRMTSQGSALSEASDLGCIYVSGVDLYYNDGNGIQIQLTASGALNAASIGAIGGDYATSTASLSYSSLSQTFTFTQAAATPAKVDCGPILLRKASASSNSITLLPASGISADYTMTLPAAVPANSMALTADVSGNISFTNLIPGGTKVLFYNTGVPAGWTRDTSVNNHFVAVVSGGSPGTSTGLTGYLSSSSDIGSHRHTGPSHQHSVAKMTAADGSLRFYYGTWEGSNYVTMNAYSLGSITGSSVEAWPAVSGTVPTNGDMISEGSGTANTGITSLGAGSYARAYVMIAQKDVY